MAGRETVIAGDLVVADLRAGLPADAVLDDPDVHRAVKAALDPLGILNPGKVVPR